jgi:hypothetical protein
MNNLINKLFQEQILYDKTIETFKKDENYNLNYLIEMFNQDYNRGNYKFINKNNQEENFNIKKMIYVINRKTDMETTLRELISSLKPELI